MAVPATSIFNDVPISAFRENWMDCISRTLSSSRAAASNSACCFSFLWRNSVIPCCTIKVKCDNQRLGYKNRRPNEKFVPYRKYSISVLPRKPVAQCVHLCDIFSSFNGKTKETPSTLFDWNTSALKPWKIRVRLEACCRCQVTEAYTSLHALERFFLPGVSLPRDSVSSVSRRRREVRGEERAWVGGLFCSFFGGSDFSY